MTKRVPGAVVRPQWSVVSSQATAYEVDYFQLEFGGRPTVAGDDVEVEFDGYSVGLHGQAVEERGQSKGHRGVVEGAGLAVDLKGHGSMKSIAARRSTGEIPRSA